MRASRAIARAARVQSYCRASSTGVLTQQTFGLLWYRPPKCKGKSEINKTTEFARFARSCARCARAIVLPIIAVPASWADGPSVRVSSLCDNSFYHFRGATFPNGGDPPVLFPIRTPPKKGTSSLRSEVNQTSRYTFRGGGCFILNFGVGKIHSQH